MNSDNHRTIEEIFRVVFELSESSPIDSISRNNLAKWDSMAHVALISALDDEFDLVMDTQDALKVDSYSSCIAVVSSYID